MDNNLFDRAVTCLIEIYGRARSVNVEDNTNKIHKLHTFAKLIVAFDTVTQEN